MGSKPKTAGAGVRHLELPRVIAVRDDHAHGENPVSVRIFAAAHAAYDPSLAARAVAAALDKIPQPMGRVVLPAGFGILPDVTLKVDWTDAHVREVEANANRWARDFRTALPARLVRVPVLVGLDARVRWPRHAPCYAVQTIAVIEGRGLAALAWKSLPAAGEYLVAGGNGDRSRRGLVERNSACAEVGGDPSLLLVCQDGIAFGTARRKPLRTSRSGCVRAAYKALLKVKPTWAFNAIHKLPKDADGRVPPSFINSHRKLAGDGIGVVSVAGLNDDEPLEACFDRVRHRLHCTTPHVDVLLG